MKRAGLLAALGLTACAAYSQHWLLLEADGTLPKAWTRPLKTTAAGVEGQKQGIVAGLWEQGHLEAGIDSCRRMGDTLVCGTHVGPVYRWARLSPSGVDEAILSEVRFRERYFDGRPIDPRRMARLYEDLLDRCENAGFPFAAVTLDSLMADSGTLRAALRLDKGRFGQGERTVLASQHRDPARRCLQRSADRGNGTANP